MADVDLPGGEDILGAFDHKIDQESWKNGGEKQGDRGLHHDQLTAELCDGVYVAKPDGVKGYNAEIDGLLKVELVADGFWIGGHFNAFRTVVHPGKSEDKDQVDRKRDQDEKKDFAGFETEIHFLSDQWQVTSDKWQVTSDKITESQSHRVTWWQSYQ